jgi:hypothetical protein
MYRLPPLFVFVYLALLSCAHHSSPGIVNDPDGKATVLKISQFDHAGMCDLLIDKNGTYHAVFQENPAIGKPVFIYYSNSKDKGASWSKPVALSDDGTGASSGYARILQDGKGSIYAIWKRYGNTANGDIDSPTLDGPGGYGVGTLFYKVFAGSSWSNAIKLNESEHLQESWFATVSPAGILNVVWAQANPQTLANISMPWYNCDYMRAVALNGTAHSAYSDLTKPAPLNNGFPPINTKPGYMNLQGYVDKNNQFHLIWEDVNNPNGVQAIKYFDGKTIRLVYNYPKNKEGNSFFNPGHLLVDEKGDDHVIFVPSAAALQSEQIWDVNMNTIKTEMLISIQQEGISIHGFQACQGPGGQMAVSIEAGKIYGSNEAFGMFYKNGSWTNVALTTNAAKAQFFSKEFIGLGGYLTSVSLLTTYSSQFVSAAYDESGNKGLLMTIAGHSVGDSGYGIDNPFIIFMPVNR